MFVVAVHVGCEKELLENGAMYLEVEG